MSPVRLWIFTVNHLLPVTENRLQVDRGGVSPKEETGTYRLFGGAVWRYGIHARQYAFGPYISILPFPFTCSASITSSGR
jgi:hypothetical protein